MDSRRTEATFIVLAIVIIGAIAAFIYFRGPSGPVPAYAPAGTLVKTFPKELILDENAAVQYSYSVDYQKDGIGQATANFSSSFSLGDLFNRYKQYFQKNNWIIREDTGLNLRGIFAVKESESRSVSVSIVDQGNIRGVQITNLKAAQ